MYRIFWFSFLRFITGLQTESFSPTKIMDLKTHFEIFSPSEWHLFLTLVELLSPLEIIPTLINELSWEVSSTLILVKMGNRFRARGWTYFKSCLIGTFSDTTVVFLILLACYFRRNAHLPLLALNRGRGLPWKGGLLYHWIRVEGRTSSKGLIISRYSIRVGSRFALISFDFALY